MWEQYSASGIKAGAEDYSWNTHVHKYVDMLDEIFKKPSRQAHLSTSFGKKLIDAKQFFITDLDGTLVEGDDITGLHELMQWLKEKPDVAFGISSGRSKALLQQALHKYPVSDPDVLICSAGTEIYYTKDFIPDEGWKKHIAYQWKRDKIVEALMNFKGISLQESEAQWPLKISYYTTADFSADRLADLNKILYDKKLPAKLLLTDNRFLDIIPRRAGKGNAVRYLSYKWQLPVDQFITAGNGGNDIDMLLGKSKAIVVANYSKELEALRGKKNIYFSKDMLSKGILEGIRFYGNL